MKNESDAAKAKARYEIIESDNGKCVFSSCENLASNTVYNPPLNKTRFSKPSGIMKAYRVCKQHVHILTGVIEMKDDGFINQLRRKPYLIHSKKLRFTVDGKEMRVVHSGQTLGSIEVCLEYKALSPQVEATE